MFNLRSSKEKDKVSGGLSDNKSEKTFDEKSVQKGILVEMEHTTSKDLAREIAQDHLSENPKYYNYLDEMEKKMDKKSFNLRSIRTAQFQPQHPSVGDRFQQDINKQMGTVLGPENRKINNNLYPTLNGLIFSSWSEVINSIEQILQEFKIEVDWNRYTEPQEDKAITFQFPVSRSGNEIDKWLEVTIKKLPIRSPYQSEKLKIENIRLT